MIRFPGIKIKKMLLWLKSHHRDRTLFWNSIRWVITVVAKCISIEDDGQSKTTSPLSNESLVKRLELLLSKV